MNLDGVHLDEKNVPEILKIVKHQGTNITEVNIKNITAETPQAQLVDGKVKRVTEEEYRDQVLLEITKAAVEKSKETNSKLMVNVAKNLETKDLSSLIQLSDQITVSEDDDFEIIDANYVKIQDGVLTITANQLDGEHFSVIENIPNESSRIKHVKIESAGATTAQFELVKTAIEIVDKNNKNIFSLELEGNSNSKIWEAAGSSKMICDLTINVPTVNEKIEKKDGDNSLFNLLSKKEEINLENIDVAKYVDVNKLNNSNISRLNIKTKNETKSVSDVDANKVFATTLLAHTESLISFSINDEPVFDIYKNGSSALHLKETDLCQKYIAFCEISSNQYFITKERSPSGDDYFSNSVVLAGTSNKMANMGDFSQSVSDIDKMDLKELSKMTSSVVNLAYGGTAPKNHIKLQNGDFIELPNFIHEALENDGLYTSYAPDGNNLAGLDLAELDLAELDNLLLLCS